MIREIIGNEFKSKKYSRYLFKYKGHDLEQEDHQGLLNIISELKTNLNNLTPNNYFKVYNLDNEIYLDSPFKNSMFPMMEPAPYNDGIRNFLLNDNLYSDIEFSKDFVKVNGKYLRFISIGMNQDTFIDFCTMPSIGDYFLSFRRVETHISKDMVDSSRKMNHSSLYKALADIEGIEVYQENEAMLRKVISKEEELFMAELVFIIRADTEKELTVMTDEKIEALVSRSLDPKIETATLNKMFTTYFPGLTPEQQKERLMHSSLLVNLLPVHKDKACKEGSVFYSRSDRPIYLNTKEGDSFSSLITGITGKGKTFLGQKVIKDLLDTGVAIYIIDPKRDYEKFALLHEAELIDGKINPMQFKDAIYLRDLILSKIPSNARKGIFDGQLLRSIRDTNAYMKDDFFEALELVASDNEIFKGIDLYFEEIRGKISSNIAPMKKFVYVMSSSFTKETLPILLVYSMEYLKRLNMPYRLVIDEAHRVFAHDPTFLDERVREMRVQNSGLITLTQSYKDLLRSDFGKTVADCSYHKIFLSQTLEGSDLGVSSFDLSKISSLKTIKDHYSEFYYKTDVNRKVMRYYPTITELELFRSGEKEREVMLNYIDEKMKYFSMSESINQYIRDKYANL